MPTTCGSDRVATLTSDMNLTVGFYEQAFDAVVVGDVPKAEDHPWMKLVDLGSGSMLNVFEVDAAAMIGECRRPGGRRDPTARPAVVVVLP